MKELCNTLNLPEPAPYNVGPVRIHLDALTVTDPCYEPNIWCALKLAVKPGTWLAHSHRVFHTWMERYFKKAHQEELDYMAKLSDFFDSHSDLLAEKGWPRTPATLDAIVISLGLKFEPWMSYFPDREYRDFKAGKFPYQTASMWILHESIRALPEMEAIGDICVDSGQAGFFDTLKFEEMDESFYPKCCEVSSDGTLDVGIGVNADSGDGDGSYPVLVGRRDGEIVAVMVVFLEDVWNCQEV